MTFEDWLAEATRLCAEEFQLRITPLDPDEWLAYFHDGASPREAVVEVMNDGT